MAASPENKPGAILWHDLTVDDATSVREFYEAVVGWDFIPHPMGDYEDYSMTAPGDKESAVSGVCHARGDNAGIPPVWMMYVGVADLSASIRACESRGGSVVQGPRSMGPWGTLAIIKDPAGAVLALMEPKKDA